MKILDQIEHSSSAISYAGLIEKIEILRSTLRWAAKLERPDIEKLLRQSHALRDELREVHELYGGLRPQLDDVAAGPNRRALLHVHEKACPHTVLRSGACGARRTSSAGGLRKA